MSFRALFGPVDEAFAAEFLAGPRAAGLVRTFDWNAADIVVRPDDDWESFCDRFPENWRPDAVVLFLQYRTIPAFLLAAPLPIIGLAGDWNLLWHHCRRYAPRCDVIVTDGPGVQAFKSEGHGDVRAGNLFGLGQTFLTDPWPETNRDIDVLFVGNFNAAVQTERQAWIARLSALANRYRIHVTTGVFGEEYRRLLARSRIVFNRSIRGEANSRVFEAIAAGSLLFMEADNRDVGKELVEGEEFVAYTADNLEEKLAYYLRHEDERRQIAEKARNRRDDFSFESFWNRIIGSIGGDLERLMARGQSRSSGPSLGDRVVQVLSRSFGGDPTLADELSRACESSPSAERHYAKGLLAAQQGPKSNWSAIAQSFQSAWHLDSSHLLAGLGLACAMDRLKQPQFAVEQATRTLAMIDVVRPEELRCLDMLPFPGGFDLLRVEWEKAAWMAAAIDRASGRQSSISSDGDCIYW